MRRLRELQLEYNKRCSEMMMKDYREPMRVRWSTETIPFLEGGSNVLRDVYLRGIGHRFTDGYDSMDVQSFGTSPVRGCYWKLPAEHYNRPYVWAKPQEPITPSSPKCDNIMVFRRYPNLCMPYEQPPKDLFSRVFLGMIDTLGYKYSQGQAICNDSWRVNLKTTEKEMSIQEGMMMAINITDELADLLKVYNDAETHLIRKEKSSMECLMMYMKGFIEVNEERVKVSKKLEALKKKMDMSNKPEENEDEDDDGDDE
jgi:hypothetical protein